MTIINMVGGGSGGYKSYTELKAMSLSDVITELNTDAQGYYDNLNGNGHIIGIGIANNDNTTYQCWDVSPIIYWNGIWRDGEIIIIKIKADSNGDLKIPVAGLSTSQSANCAYNWWVSYDGGNETQYNGTGSKGSITIASGLTAETEHTVVIRPNSDSYQRARAFGYWQSNVETSLIEIVYESSYKGYAYDKNSLTDSNRFHQYHGCTSLINTSFEICPDSTTRVGNNFRSSQYHGCTSLVNAADEILNNNITTITSNFRNSMYSGCSSLKTPAKEFFPSSMTEVPNYFRQSQYRYCTALETTAEEKISNSITTIGTTFRGYQYGGCTSLKTPAQENLPNTVTTIGTSFRGYQYDGCTSLVSAAEERMSSLTNSVDGGFRTHQYSGCTSLTNAAKEVFIDSGTTIISNFRNNQYSGCTSLITAAEEFLPSSITSIGSNFRKEQYSGCTSLVSTSEEVLPSSVDTISTDFRRQQYYGCSNLKNILGWVDLSIGNATNYRYQQFYNCTSNKIVKVLGDVGYASYNSSTLSNSYVSRVLVPSAYISNFTGASTYPRSSITDSKFVGY